MTFYMDSTWQLDKDLPYRFSNRGKEGVYLIIAEKLLSEEDIDSQHNIGVFAVEIPYEDQITNIDECIEKFKTFITNIKE